VNAQNSIIYNYLRNKFLSLSNALIIISITYPESLRYNEFFDTIEQEVNEIRYIKLGSKGSDFSTGKFQMKPSFIEKLEEAHKRYKLSNFDVVKYPFYKTEKQKREERIKRLKSEEWQMIYLALFVSTMDVLYKDMKLTDKQKILIYSSAYNVGFHKPRKTIIDHIGKKRFKVLNFPIMEMHSYTELAWCHFEDFKEYYTTRFSKDLNLSL
jgi:hypothetical protein